MQAEAIVARCVCMHTSFECCIRHQQSSFFQFCLWCLLPFFKHATFGLALHITITIFLSKGENIKLDLKIGICEKCAFVTPTPPGFEFFFMQQQYIICTVHTHVHFTHLIPKSWGNKDMAKYVTGKRSKRWLYSKRHAGKRIIHLIVCCQNILGTTMFFSLKVCGSNNSSTVAFD